MENLPPFIMIVKYVISFKLSATLELLRCQPCKTQLMVSRDTLTTCRYMLGSNMNKTDNMNFK